MELFLIIKMNLEDLVFAGKLMILWGKFLCIPPPCFLRTIVQDHLCLAKNTCLFSEIWNQNVQITKQFVIPATNNLLFQPPTIKSSLHQNPSSLTFSHGATSEFSSPYPYCGWVPTYGCDGLSHADTLRLRHLLG